MCGEVVVMSEETYIPSKFCWPCGRKLRTPHYTVKEVDGLPRTMHKYCAKHDKPEIDYRNEDHFHIPMEDSND